MEWVQEDFTGKFQNRLHGWSANLLSACLKGHEYDQSHYKVLYGILIELGWHFKWV